MEDSILKSKNTYFSKLNGNDLLELLVMIENRPIEYRECLNLSKKLTFGLEIEWEGKHSDVLCHYLNTCLPNWRFDTDGSINVGGEVKSPKLIDEKKSWIELQKVCDCLKRINANSSERTGGHIHFGVNIFKGNLDTFLLFLKTYAVYENILFRFYYGEYLRHRNTSYTSNQNIAKRIRKNINQIDSIEELNDSSMFLRSERNYAINFGNMIFGSKSTNKNTIELRIPNGSIEEIIWQNNVNTFAKFILKVVNGEIDYEYINSLFDALSPDSDSVARRNEIVLKQALEFVDLIFDNDLDKFYFLRQYFKNFEMNNGLKENKLAKRFIV